MPLACVAMPVFNHALVAVERLHYDIHELFVRWGPVAAGALSLHALCWSRTKLNFSWPSIGWRLASTPVCFTAISMKRPA